ncbi:MAG: DUF1318 domain-containing protein [Phycisphaerales bacterium]|nr:DUF1318 domain-containing protein [Phycisphaerales bacterium]
MISIKHGLIRSVFVLLTTAACSASAGCLSTHNDVVIQQQKPLEVDVNLNGKLTLVVHEAHDDLSYITGQQPGSSPAAATGVPTKTNPGSPASTLPAASGTSQPSSFNTLHNSHSIVLLDMFAATAGGLPDKATVLHEMRANYPAVRKLKEAQLVGEAHSGYVVALKALSPTQQQTIQRQDFYRRELYQIVARQTSQSFQAVSLIFFKQWLRFLKPGDWYQKQNAGGQWVWTQYK